MTDDKAEDRRQHDRTHADIRELILKTDAPKDKAMLLILLKISESLESNTVLTQDVSDKLDQHIKRYDVHETEDKVRVGSIKTGWRILSGVVVVLQGLTMMAVKNHVDEDKQLVASVASIKQDIARDVGSLRHDVDVIIERKKVEDELLRRKD